MHHGDKTPQLIGAPATQLSEWQRSLARSESRRYSQSYQDGVLAKIFESVGSFCVCVVRLDL